VYTNVSQQYNFEGQPGFKAEYFDNTELKGTPVVGHTGPGLELNWQEGEAVIGNIRARDFSARFTTDYKASETGDVVFEVEGDDGYRFFVDGKEQLEAWTRNRWRAKNIRIKTEKGRTYRLVVEYNQQQGKGSIALRVGNFQRTDFKALARRVRDADAIVYVGGISPQLEGEEMKVNEPGFDGGDRTTILLPAVQTETLKALKSTRKPVVFVMMTGSAIA